MVLSPTVFNLFIGDTDSGTECTLSKYSNGIKLCDAARSSPLEERDAIQMDVARLELTATFQLTKRLREVILPLYSARVRTQLCPLLGSSVQQRYGVPWAGLAENFEHDEGTGASLQWEKAERVEPVQSQEETER